MTHLFFSVLLIIFGLIDVDLKADERGSSAPYISGDSFRVNCNFTYDELDRSLDSTQVEYGNTIFVKTDYLEEFFCKIHPEIQHDYILVTHNSDYHVPGKFEKMLNDNKIIAWFGQNVEECDHLKIHPIPIGIANRCWGHGNIDTFKKMQIFAPSFSRNIILYMNFAVGTNIAERSKVAAMFRDKSYCVISEPKEMTSYLADLCQSVFVLSPRGNGLDCHRTWEALLMGAYPIVRSSSLDPMYENLPVVIVNDWSEINEAFLQMKYLEFQSKSFDLEKLYIDYWLKKIESFKTNQ